MRFLNSSTFFLTAFVGVVIAGPATLVWQKPFTEWTQQDAQKIMSDSPWVKQVPMPAAGRPSIAVIEPGSQGAAPPSAAMGNPSNSTTGNNMSTAGNPGSQGPANQNGLRTLPNAQTPSNVNSESPAPEPGDPVNIIWASAEPVRLAVLKLQSGVNTPTSGEVERVSKPRENYTIAVTGFPAPDADTDLNKMAAKATISVKGKPAAVASACTYRKIGNANVYFFRFPKTALSISEDDRQVEFKAVFGQAELKHRFELKGMEYQGQLAL